MYTDINKIPPGSYGLRLDSDLGIIQPWYTHPALDEIQGWDVKEKTVLEWGGGCSSLWWASKAKRVFTIESEAGWCGWIKDTASYLDINNLTVENRTAEDIATYVSIPDNFCPDIVCVDGEERTECLKAALLLPRPFTLIVDNWMQDYVYLDVEAERMMSDYAGKFYIQPDHTNHEGHPWQTAIWRIA